MINKSLMQLKVDSTPAGFAKTLIAEGDLFFWEKGNFWAVNSYELAKGALMNPAISCDRSPFFISRMPNLDLSLIQDFFSVVGRMMVMSDGKKHLARRRIAAFGVSKDVLDRFAPKVQKTVDHLLADAASRPEVEFVSQVARKIPSTVLADLFCIEEKDRENFYLWSDNMTQFFGGSSSYENEDGIRVNESAKNIRAFFEELVARRRKDPLPDDFLSQMLARQGEFELDDAELVSQAIMMLVAGQVTTTDQICNNLFELLNQTEALARLRQHPELMGLAIEELTRLDPAVTFIFRVTAQDTHIGQQPIKKGDVVFISTHAVNRDARVFENPHACDIARDPNPHMGYGYGPHFCLGASLAQVEMKTLFSSMLNRFSSIVLDPDREAERKHHSLSFSGFETLPLRVQS